MRSAGIHLTFVDGRDVILSVQTYKTPESHREVVANGMILTMEHEIKKVIQHYKKFTEQGTVLNNKEKSE